VRSRHHRSDKDVVSDKSVDGGVRTDMDTAYTTSRLPGSFGGVRNLQRDSGRSKGKVKKFLAAQDAYALHKPTRIRFPRRKTYSKGIGDLFQIDLVDLSSLSSFNDGMRYLLNAHLHRRFQQESLGR